MSDRETLPQGDNGVAQEATAAVKRQEQINKELERKELSEKDRETLLKEKEEIKDKIEQLEKQREEMIKNVNTYLLEAEKIVREESSVNKQVRKILDSGIFDLLPKNILKTMLEKFLKNPNFFDWRYPEEWLNEDPLGKEIESLKRRRGTIDDILEKKNQEEEALREDIDNLSENTENTEENDGDIEKNPENPENQEEEEKKNEEDVSNEGFSEGDDPSLEQFREELARHMEKQPGSSIEGGIEDK